MDPIPLLPHTKRLRNTCILAHVDHGKTTITDTLLVSNGIISSRNAGKIRYMDWLVDEVERGITVKSAAVGLVYRVRNTGNDSDNQSASKESKEEQKESKEEQLVETDALTPILINLIDSPGHIDFSAEVVSATRITDSALIVIDIIEGVCSQTVTMIRHAVWTGLQCVVVINKMDRCITECAMSVDEAGVRITQVLGDVNSVMVRVCRERDALVNTDHVESDPTVFDPVKGNVVFASAVDGWAFRTIQFAAMYSHKLGIPITQIAPYMFGEYYLDMTKKRVVSGNAKRSLFVGMVLDSIWKVYEAAGCTGQLCSEEKVTKIVKAIGIQTASKSRENGDGKSKGSVWSLLGLSTSAAKDSKLVASTIMTKWIPVPNALVSCITQCTPDPSTSQRKRYANLIKYVTDTCTGDDNGVYAKCLTGIVECSQSEKAPVIVYVSKLFGVQRNMIPTESHGMGGDQRGQLSAEEIRSRRREAIDRSRLLNQMNREAGHDDAESTSELAGDAKDDGNDEVLIGFARIYSGVLKKGQSVYVMGPKYDPHDPLDIRSQHMSQCVVENLFLMMGRELRAVDQVYAGNVFGILGLSDVVTKSATVSTTEWCPSMGSVMFGRMVMGPGSDQAMMDTIPILRVAIEPTDASTMDTLIEGMKMVCKSDPCAEVVFERSGENVLVCAGELHLERCLRELRDRYAVGVRFSVSEPIVPYRETVSDVPALVIKDTEKDAEKSDGVDNTLQGNVPVGTVLMTTKNGLCRVRMRAIPLPSSIHTFLDTNTQRIQRLESRKSGATQDGDEMDSYDKIVGDLCNVVDKDDGGNASAHTRDMEWMKMMKSIVAVGPRNVWTNVMVCMDDSYGMTRWGRSSGGNSAKYEASFVSGFEMGCANGPLCGEPMSGLCFVIEKVDMIDCAPCDDDDDVNVDLVKQVSMLPGQILTMMRNGIRKSFLGWSPRLMLAMYECEFQSPTESLGRVYGVISRRRGRIVSEEMRDGATDIFTIRCVIPVVESFGVADELRKRTSGSAASHPLLVFKGYEVLDDLDPFWVPITEDEMEEHGEKMDNENVVKKYVDKVRERKGMGVKKKVVEYGEKQKTMKNK